MAEKAVSERPDIPSSVSGIAYGGSHAHGSEGREQQAGHSQERERQPQLDVPQGQHALRRP